MKPSKSPERHTFQRDSYIKSQQEEGKAVSEDYLEMFDKILEREIHKFDDPSSKINNMEWDLLTHDWILEKARTSERYAQNLYAAICNNEFIKIAVIPILKNETWGCSWRYAGGIIADMRQEGDYIDWYCSGIRNDYDDEESGKLWDERKYMPEGCITDEIRNDLQRLGWAVAPGGDWEDFEQGVKKPK
jgi:hypothetical protein